MSGSACQTTPPGMPVMQVPLAVAPNTTALTPGVVVEYNQSAVAVVCVADRVVPPPTPAFVSTNVFCCVDGPVVYDDLAGDSRRTAISPSKRFAPVRLE